MISFFKHYFIHIKYINSIQILLLIIFFIIYIIIFIFIYTKPNSNYKNISFLPLNDNDINKNI